MNNFRKVSFTSIGLLALAACIASSPAFADGECLEWKVNELWQLTQSNGTHVTMRLQQTGVHLQGVAEYSYYSNSAGQPQTVSGPVDGQLEDGKRLRLSAYWSNGSVGLYVGEIQADGGISGYTSDRNNVNNKATFAGSGYPTCVTRAAVAPPPPPAKPALALGRVQTPVGTPATAPKTMCESAASARARNSPAAPALEKRCAEEGGPPPVALGRIKVPSAVPAPLPPVAAAAVVAPAPPAPPRAIDPAELDALAAKGAEIAGIDPAVDAARSAEAGAFYQLGFDIATGLFGDPVLGAEGLSKMDPISTGIRSSLSASGQRGFDASMNFHLAKMK